jgi:hypothetical protein
VQAAQQQQPEEEEAVGGRKTHEREQARHLTRTTPCVASLHTVTTVGYSQPSRCRSQTCEARARGAAAAAAAVRRGPMPTAAARAAARRRGCRTTQRGQHRTPSPS